MSEVSKPCMRENLSQAYRSVAKQLYEGISVKSIVQDLLEGNWRESSAKRIIQSVEQSLRDREQVWGTTTQQRELPTKICIKLKSR
jgi:hypothetical protein